MKRTVGHLDLWAMTVCGFAGLTHVFALYQGSVFGDFDKGWMGLSLGKFGFVLAAAVTLAAILVSLRLYRVYTSFSTPGVLSSAVMLMLGFQALTMPAQVNRDVITTLVLRNICLFVGLAFGLYFFAWDEERSSAS